MPRKAPPSWKKQRARKLMNKDENTQESWLTFRDENDGKEFPQDEAEAVCKECGQQCSNVADLASHLVSCMGNPDIPKDLPAMGDDGDVPMDQMDPDVAESDVSVKVKVKGDAKEVKKILGTKESEDPDVSDEEPIKAVGIAAYRPRGSNVKTKKDGPPDPLSATITTMEDGDAIEIDDENIIVKEDGFYHGYKKANLTTKGLYGTGSVTYEPNQKIVPNDSNAVGKTKKKRTAEDGAGNMGIMPMMPPAPGVNKYPLIRRKLIKKQMPAKEDTDEVDEGDSAFTKPVMGGKKVKAGDALGDGMKSYGTSSRKDGSRRVNRHGGNSQDTLSNSTEVDYDEDEYISEDEMEEGVLSTDARNSLSDKDFALSGRRYPIHDEAHARNALARASQMVKAGKLSSSDAATIRSKVHARYPDIKVSEEEVTEEVTIFGTPREDRLCETVHFLEAANPAGTDWKVVMIQAGVSKNRTYYSPSLLSKSTGLFEGTLCFADHDPENPTNRSVKEVVGWYSDAKYEPGIGVTSTFHALESRPWFTDMLREAYQRGKPDLFGFSINGLGNKRLGKVNGESVFVIEDLQKIDSVDAVINPSAGGRVLRLVADTNTDDREELELIDKLTLEELKATRPDLYEQIVKEAKAAADASDDDEDDAPVAKKKAKAKEALQSDAPPFIDDAASNPLTTKTGAGSTVAKGLKSPPTPTADTTKVSEQEQRLEEMTARMEKMIQESEKRQRVSECKTILAEALTESKLPDPVKRKLEKKYSGKEFDAEQLQEDITEEREILSKLFNVEQPFSRTAGSRITMGDDHRDRAVKALDGFWDNKTVDGVAPARSLMEAYAIWRGTSMWDVQAQELISEAARSYDSSGARILEDISGAVGDSGAGFTWTKIMGDSITRRMLKEYNDLPYNEWRLISDVVAVTDFRTQRRTRFGGYAAPLAVVTETSAYPSLASPTDQEATYVPAKRGGTEKITLEMIARDDLSAIRRVPFKLARAAKITLYRWVFDQLSLSAAAGSATLTYQTGTHLFTTANANALVSTTGADAALNDANLLTARQKLIKQTAFNESTHLLGLKPKYLIVPTDLNGTAMRLRDNEFTYGGDGAAGDKFRSDVNIHRGVFDIIEVPYWGDNSDGRASRWILTADPADIPMIEVGFFQGKEEPELFVQDLDNVGSMFDKDQVTYKLRHIYGGTILDHRGFVGSVAFSLNP